MKLGLFLELPTKLAICGSKLRVKTLQGLFLGQKLDLSQDFLPPESLGRACTHFLEKVSPPDFDWTQLNL